MKDESRPSVSSFILHPFEVGTSMNTRRFCCALWLVPVVLFLPALTQPGSPGRAEERKEVPSAPVIRLVGDRDPAVAVTGLSPADLRALARLDQAPERWHQLFAVYVEHGGDPAQQPAMLGSYRVEKDALRFQPRFPLQRGVSYRAVLHPERLPGRAGPAEKTIEMLLRLPKVKPAVPTVVTAVYPSRDDLPENQLKFYLHFSAPMSRGEAYEHIRLLHDGKADDRAFLELPQELWDREGKRLTLLLDPGRVKRELAPREAFGPVLEAGKRYTLVIDREWQDGEGHPLKESFRKTFRVLPPDGTQPSPKTWKLEPPPAGSTNPLVMTSPKSLDHALLHRMLWVTDDRGRKMPGTVAVTKQETCWQFTPASAWTVGRYHLVADTWLEDLAGNSIARPFEVDEQSAVQHQNPARTVQLPFEVRANRSVPPLDR
jgi:hypothetical protein